MIDASATVIELALTVLIMFLPHITSSLTSDFHLPKLFLIYSRMLCWDRFGGANSEEQNPTDEESEKPTGQDSNEDSESEHTWEKLHRSFDCAENTAPGLLDRKSVV